jgi:hypothetical protein
VTSLDETTVIFASELAHTAADGKVTPRFSTTARREDLRWSDELGAWRLWGRDLCRGRGGVGIDERRVVSELRDRGVLPARASRRHRNPPAGGEHLNLALSLFSRGIDWAREIERLRNREGLSEAAQAAVDDYEERYKRKLTEGYASPDADDSWAELGEG